MEPNGKLIKEELERRKISQKELCDKTGITESAMSKYLNSDRPLRGDIIAKIASALDVSLYQLFGLSNNDEDTFNVCKTALLARNGNKLSDEEKKELINIILGHE